MVLRAACPAGKGSPVAPAVRKHARKCILGQLGNPTFGMGAIGTGPHDCKIRATCHMIPCLTHILLPVPQPSAVCITLAEHREEAHIGLSLEDLPIPGFLGTFISTPEKIQK